MANLRWPPPTITAYYRAALAEAQKAVLATPDDRSLGMDLDQWTDYLVDKYALREIQFDQERSPRMVEVEIEHTLRGYDIYSDRGPGERIKTTQVRVEVPVVPSETLREIWRHELAPNQFSMVKYPEYEYDDRSGVISTVAQPERLAVDDAIHKIRMSVEQYNQSIRSENQNVRAQLYAIAGRQQEAVGKKHSKLDALSADVGIPLVKKADPAKVVPTAPRIRQAIAPVLPPAKKPQERPVLDATKFAAILELIDNQCRAFERTPQSFSALSEEGLRDIILSSLNAVFEGAATGETFQGIGKIDLHLRISRGEVFVAEIKFWAGPSSLNTTLEQLRGRLTWRDAYGVAIILSRQVGFADVLRSISEELQRAQGFVAGSLRKPSDNHLVARFSIPSDPERHAEIHTVAYNLYTPEPGRRQTRRQ